MATQSAALAMDGNEWVPVVGFGDRLRIVRREKRRSQKEMAALLEVKQVTYASWEAGMATPSYENVIKIARRLFMLDRVPQWWTLGADDPAGTLRGTGTRSSTDRASDYGSERGHIFELPASPFRRHVERRRQLSVVPLHLVADGQEIA